MATRTLHIILALSVFLSSAGLVVNQHFCQGKRQEFALFVHAGGCRPAAMAGACSAADRRQDRHGPEMRGNCCQDRTDYVKLDQDQQPPATPKAGIKLPPLFHVAAPVFRHAASGIVAHSFLTYKPPIVCADFPAWLQTFRL